MTQSDPKRMSNSSNPMGPEELFAQAEPFFDNAMRFAFRRYHHPPSAENVARLKQRLSLHLLEDNFRRLRSYNQQAKLETWLQVLSNRLVSRFLRQRARSTSFEDVPSGLFTQQPVQEELLLQAEREESLKEALDKLTFRERKLFELLHEGYKSKEIAKILMVKVASVHRKRNALVRKIQEIIGVKRVEKKCN